MPSPGKRVARIRSEEVEEKLRSTAEKSATVGVVARVRRRRLAICRAIGIGKSGRRDDG
ncbi:hypothetical protein Hanom_Chr01g00086421 [Helianthus anomalus]